MINNEFPEVFQPRYGRKILQTNSSSSSFDTSQPIFIVLLCIIIILSIAFVITIIILCYRYYSHRKRKLKNPNQFQEILSVENNQPSTVPISITPTSVFSSSVRSSEHLFSNQNRQTSSINTLPSCRLQQSIIDAYLNDLNSFQPATIDVKQLKSYLFIDLHSTSSETFPDNISKQFNNKTITSGYNTSTDNESQRKYYYYLKHQQRRRSTLKSKRSYNPRFLMRERSLPNNLHKLPQLRRITTRQQKHLFGLDDSNNSSTNMINQDLQTINLNLSTTTDEYSDSHVYHVNQKPSIVHQHFPHSSLHYKKEPYYFEIVSTTPDDYNDIPIADKSSPIIDNRIAYMNDSIIV